CSVETLMGMDLLNPNPAALMYQTGYLTIKNYDRRSDTVTLGIPNREVRKGLFDVLLPFYVKVRQGTVEGVVSDLILAILDGKPAEMIELLDIFLAGVPYELKMENENNLHNALYILLTLIGIKTDAEVHTSDGRIDLIIKTDDYIYIIELKFDSDSHTAMRQIELKDYERPYLNDSRRIFRIGVNFSSKTRHLDKPFISEVRDNL
ncbi:MAG: PD-(D/E)XK nuclease domain-containing protein, partial [Muribaculaceae bacterium]|nr:PD-(D/E)XK nuclease domain-containing protein [Muribaculaceae bacterium]